MNHKAGVILLLAAMLAGAPGTPLLAANSMTSRSSGIMVANVSPGDLAADVQTNSPLTIEFGGAVTPAFYPSVSFNLFQGSKNIDGELFFNQNTRQIMFKPKASLTDGQTYTAQVTYQDANGATAEKIWSFRTRGSAGGQRYSSAPAPAANGVGSDFALPSPAGTLVAGPGAMNSASANGLTIVNANMAQGAIQPSNPLEITFSEPLDLGSLREAPVKLLNGRDQIGIDYKLSRDMKTLSLVPRTALRPGANYRITIAQGLAGTAGARLAKNTLIPFSVGGNAGSVEVPDHVLEEAPPPPQPVAPAAGRANHANPFDGGSSDGSADAAFTYPSPAPRRMAPVAPMAPAAAPVAQPLRIVAMSPRNGDAVTNLSQPVTVAFNGDVRGETLNEFTFRLEDDFGPVPAKIRYISERRQAVLTPVGVLDSNRSYRVVLTQGISDPSGRQLVGGLTATFSTRSPVNSPAMPEFGSGQGTYGAAPSAAPSTMAMKPMTRTRQAPPAPRIPAPDPRRESAALEVMDDESSQMPDQGGFIPEEEEGAGNAPMVESRPRQAQARSRENLSTLKVTGISPAANAEGVSRESRIMVQFNEDLSASSINPISFSVFGQQKRVEGRVSYDAARRRATFIPTEPLDAEIQYKVLLSDKVKSRSGEPLISRYTWQFTTTAGRVRRYQPRSSIEADAAFSIPLVDGKGNARRDAPRSASASSPSTGNSSSFTYLSPKHWAFKSVRHLTSKGVLPEYPFKSGMKVSRYEMAMVINSALNNLKNLQKVQKNTKLRVADLVELEQLAIGFRNELRSCGTDVSWFVRFMDEQGVRLDEVERRVETLDSRA